MFLHFSKKTSHFLHVPKACHVCAPDSSMWCSPLIKRECKVVRGFISPVLTHLSSFMMFLVWWCHGLTWAWETGQVPRGGGHGRVRRSVLGPCPVGFILSWWSVELFWAPLTASLSVADRLLCERALLGRWFVKQEMCKQPEQYPIIFLKQCLNGLRLSHCVPLRPFFLGTIWSVWLSLTFYFLNG